MLSLSSSSDYLNTSAIVGLVKQHQIDAVHPGYGFLSESAEFARRVWEEAGAVVVGPGWDILENTSDKLGARLLAVECGVPVLPGTGVPTGTMDDIKDFAETEGFPIMLKAVDGG